MRALIIAVSAAFLLVGCPEKSTEPTPPEGGSVEKVEKAGEEAGEAVEKAGEEAAEAAEGSTPKIPTE